MFSLTFSFVLSHSHSICAARRRTVSYSNYSTLRLKWFSEIILAAQWYRELVNNGHFEPFEVSDV